MSSLERAKHTLESEVKELHASADEEASNRQTAALKLKSLSAQVDSLNEQLEEEQGDRSELQMQLTSANAQVSDFSVSHAPARVF